MRIVLETVSVVCPYCGETIEVLVDCSAGSQEYLEDCQVCCQPMHLSVRIDPEGEPSVEARQE